MSETILKVENLVIRYGEIRAVKGISFELRRGEIFYRISDCLHQLRRGNLSTLWRRNSVFKLRRGSLSILFWKDVLFAGGSDLSISAPYWMHSLTHSLCFLRIAVCRPVLPSTRGLFTSAPASQSMRKHSTLFFEHAM